MLMQIIPANTDREFLRAKKAVQREKPPASSFDWAVPATFDESKHPAMLEAVVRDSKHIMQVLHDLRDTDERLYLGGGMIRSAVWDWLHGYSATPVDDVDIIYFDELDATKQHDDQAEADLKSRRPNLKWSVKNQARMHVTNNESKYTSLTDAVSKWPETATAVIARLDINDKLVVIAPHGCSDLFRLVVSPTPHFKSRMERYNARLADKKWASTWNRLRFVTDVSMHAPSPVGDAP